MLEWQARHVGEASDEVVEREEGCSEVEAQVGAVCREIAARNVDITVAEWELLSLAASSSE